MTMTPQRASLRHIATTAILLSGVGLLAGTMSGCFLFRKESASTTKPVVESSTFSGMTAVPAALQPVNRPVVQGPLPQVYLVESDSTIRVTNVATGEEVATFPAKASQIVRVETRGVLLQNRPVMGAQLAPGVYAVHIEMPDAGSMSVSQTRTTATLPQAPPPADQRPATQPATPTQ
jgi:hypothetical protein